MRSFIGFIIVAAAAPTLAAAEPGWKAGVAVRQITPDQPQWLAGYASRTRPAQGRYTELYVKALALEDPAGGRFVLLTSDLVGVSRKLTEEVAAEVGKRTGLPRGRLLFTCSHTHTAPILGDPVTSSFNIPPDEAAKIPPYTAKVRNWMIEAMRTAVADLKPATLAVGQGTAGFAVNRRQPTPKGVINGYNPDGPVDHSVPVLRVTAADGKLRAAVFGYACHNTTLAIDQYGGDYAGFAQQYVEEKHPGAVAMFWIGCGGDQNPLPRGTVELCRKYGRQLADAVEATLAGPMTPVRGKLAVSYATIAVPFGETLTREQINADLLSKNHAYRKRAERLSKVLQEAGRLPDRYPHYPVQVVRLGEQVLWVALGGEVVVEYALRLKRELAGGPAVWVAGYANNVLAYIPTARQLAEGGYEPDSSQVYYGHPGKWAPAIEDLIVAEVRRQVKELPAK
jgi:hypothetical protein